MIDGDAGVVVFVAQEDAGNSSAVRSRVRQSATEGEDLLREE